MKLAIAIVLAAAMPAAAAPVTLFPLSAGKLPTALQKLPNTLTQALAKAYGTEVAKVPIEDAAGLLDCDPEASSCIEAVGKNVKAKRMVFGSVTVDDDRAVHVTLTRFDPGPERQQKTYDLSSTSADDLADELVRVSAPLFGGKAPKGGGDGPRDKRPDGEGGHDKVVGDPLDEGNPLDEGTKPPDDERPDKPEKHDEAHGDITPATWGVLGGGALLGGLGVVFLAQASSIADDVRAAPHDTPDDFAKLTALESKGQTRQRLGIGLTAVGAVGLAYGIYRAVTERSASPAHAEPAAMLTPVPIEGGAALVLTLGAR